MRRLLRENGLSIVLVSAFAILWIDQSVAGYREFNEEQRGHGRPESAYRAYLGSAHFWEATRARARGPRSSRSQGSRGYAA